MNTHKIAEIESSLIPQQFKNVCLLCVCVCVHIEWLVFVFASSCIWIFRCVRFFFNLSHTHTEPKPRTAPLSSLTVMKTPSFFLMLFFFHSPQLFFLNPPV